MGLNDDLIVLGVHIDTGRLSAIGASGGWDEKNHAKTQDY